MKYLLLRDNKQTGPYSTEELITKGLKPYDLVWLEGKSAAWRYPSELQELKPYAPVVEEQPYDRFYKKPQHSTTALEQAAAKEKMETARGKNEVLIAELKKEIVATNLVADERPVPVMKSLPSKKIYVTLPASNGYAGAWAPLPTAAGKKENGTVQQNFSERPTNMEKKEEPSEKELNEKPVASKATQLVVADETSDYSSFSRRMETSSPKEEKLVIKEEPLYRDRDGRRGNRKLIVRSLIAACLLLGGVVIGLAISYSRQQSNNKDLENLVKSIQEREKKSQLPPAVTKPNPAPADSILLNANAAKTNGKGNESKTSQDLGAGKNDANQLAQYASKKDKTLPSREIKPVTLTVTHSDESHTIPSVANGQEKREGNQAAAEAARKNISQLVLVDISKYKTGVLGGISDLRLTLSNNSSYPLDQVLVEVKYLGPEKKVVKTQTLTFSDIAPGEQRTLDAPKSNRGVAVDYTITRINSRALGLAQLGL